MKKFSDMTTDEVVDVINQSKELRDMLEDAVQECEMDYISDKLGCFEYAGVDYSIGFYDDNYFNVKDNDLFVEGVRKSCNHFGLTTDTEKMLNMVENLRSTNLYDYWCKKLAKKYDETELESVVKMVEEICSDLHYGEVSEYAYDYVDIFVMNDIGDYLWDADTKTIYKPVKISA